MANTYPTISYTFQIQPDLTKDIPALFYFPQAINDFGQIAGELTLRGPSTAFLYDHGVVNTDVVSGPYEFSDLGGINDLGQYAGSVTTDRGLVEAILISNGVLQTFTYPGGISTRAFGINNLGQVVGETVTSSGVQGFAGTPGNLSLVDVPNASQTIAYAINDWGQIAGTYQDSSGDQHGFIDTNGHYASIDVPGAQSTSVTGINDWDQVVGSYVDSAGQTHGFVETGGQFQTLDVSGAFLTSATGINNLGQITGYAESFLPAGTSTPLLPEQAQVWVAKPSFIHGTGSTGTTIPDAPDLAALIRGIVGNQAGQRDIASLWKDVTSGSLPAAIAKVEAAVAGITGHLDWTGLSSHHTWSMVTHES